MDHYEKYYMKHDGKLVGKTITRVNYEKYYMKHYGKLVGKTITRVIRDEHNEIWGFECKDPKGEITHVWVLRDEEGNGAGALDIIENVENAP